MKTIPSFWRPSSRSLSALFPALVLLLPLGSCRAEPPKPAPVVTASPGGAAAPGSALPAPPAPTMTPAQQAELQKAAELWKSGRRDEARLAYSRLLLGCPDCLEAARDLVDLLLETAEPVQAVEVMRDRIDSSGRRAGGLFGLAYAQARVGTLEGMREAAGLLREARALRPDLQLLTLTLAEVLAALDQRAEAAGLYVEVIGQLRAQGDWEQESKAWIRRAQLLHLEGDPGTRAAYDEAAARAREKGDRTLEALARNGTGGWLFSQGDVEGTLRAFGEALQAADLGGDEQGALAALQNLAVVHEELWQDKEALQRLEELVSRLDRAGKPDQAAAARLVAGKLMGRLSALDEAMTILQQAFDTFEKSDSWAMAAEALHSMGQVLHRNERYQDAVVLFGQALQVRRTLAELLDDHRPVAETLIALGEAQAELQPKDAVEPLQEALDLATKAKEKAMIVLAARELGRVLFATGKPERVPQLISRIEAEGEAEPFLTAQLLASQGKLDEAVAQGERAVDPALALTSAQLLPRYSFLLELYLGRGQPGDDRRAFGLAAAGRAAANLLRLEKMRIGVQRGVAPARLHELRSFAAQAEGMQRILDGADSPAVAQHWERRLETLRAQQVVWRSRVTAESRAWALLHFPEQVRKAAEELTLPEGEVHLHLVAGAKHGVLFALRGAELTVLPGEGATSRPGQVALLARAQKQQAGARRLTFSPPAGGQAFGWGPTLAPAPVLPVVSGPAVPAPVTGTPPAATPPAATPPAATPPAATPPARVTLDLLTPLDGLFEEDRTGQVVQVKVTAEQQAKGIDVPVELVARALLYAGAAEVRFLLPKGKPLIYVAP